MVAMVFKVFKVTVVVIVVLVMVVMLLKVAVALLVMVCRACFFCLLPSFCLPQSVHLLLSAGPLCWLMKDPDRRNRLIGRNYGAFSIF
jgi:hypothetical protein